MRVFNLKDIENFQRIGCVFHAETMPSTSDTAKEKLLEAGDIQLPFLVLCDQQTAGRGQRGNTWQSNPQSLTFTWCISAESIPIANRPLLSLIAGLSVCEAIDMTDVPNAKLKWPNDILIDRKKVCGILVEKISSADQSWFLVGIGINVNQTVDELEAMKQSSSSFSPGSLRLFSEHEIQIPTLLKNVLQRLSENAESAESEHNWPQQLNDRFEFLGDSVTFTTPDGGIVTGVFKGVDTSGRIQIDVDGSSCCFASGQLSLLQTPS